MTALKWDGLWQNWGLLEQRLNSPSTKEQDYYRLVSDYTCVSCRLASQLQQQHNALLQEWCLRYCLFTLAHHASVDPKTHSVNNDMLRQLCLDQLYIPLLALQRLYLQQPDGRRQINQLKHQLQHLFNQPSEKEKP